MRILRYDRKIAGTEGRINLEKELPVKIIRFGAKRFYGVDLYSLLDCLEYYEDDVNSFNLIMHHNLTINNEIMSESTYYFIRLLEAVELIKEVNTPQIALVSKYLLDYLNKESDEFEKIGIAHKNKDAINYIKNTMTYQIIINKIGMRIKQVKNYEIYLINALDIVNYLFRDELKRKKILADIPMKYYNNSEYFKEGVFFKKTYVTMPTVIKICDDLLFDNTIEDNRDTLNFRPNITDSQISHFYDLREVMEIEYNLLTKLQNAKLS